MEIYYNHERLHSSIDYSTPGAFEEALLTEEKMHSEM